MSYGRWAGRQVNSSFSLSDRWTLNSPKWPIRRSRCVLEKGLYKGQQRKRRWGVVTCWFPKIEGPRGFLIEQKAKHWAELCQDLRTPGSGWRWFRCRLEICFNKDCSINPPSRASAEFFIKKRHLRWREPRDYISSELLETAAFSLLTRRKKKRWKYRSKRRRRDSGRSWAVTEL